MHIRTLEHAHVPLEHAHISMHTHMHVHIHTHMTPMTDNNSTMLLWVYTRAVATQLVITLV